jgi:ABC-type microcin C transport system permease subunit YejB
MNGESARNYLRSSGMSEEQIHTVERAFTLDTLKEIREELAEMQFRYVYCKDEKGEELYRKHISLFDVIAIIDKHIEKHIGEQNE